MPERLQKILSAHGAASRREAEKLISEGRVTVNGIAASTGQSAQFGKDIIAIDGIPLDLKADPVYIMLNKPNGYLTTVRDDRGRKTVMHLLTGLGTRVYPAGRLDIDSEGLLLLTNDGRFANAVAHPSFNNTKTYEVRVRGDINRAVSLLQQQVSIPPHVVKAVSAELLEKTEDGGIIKITISEGRNRQVRRMCAACGVYVLALCRTAVGTVTLGRLGSGMWRHLTGDELRSLME